MCVLGEECRGRRQTGNDSRKVTQVKLSIPLLPIPLPMCSSIMPNLAEADGKNNETFKLCLCFAGVEEEGLEGGQLPGVPGSGLSTPALSRARGDHLTGLGEGPSMEISSETARLRPSTPPFPPAHPYLALVKLIKCDMRAWDDSAVHACFRQYNTFSSA
jgi:hypothetical protein